MLLLQDRK